MKRLNSFILVVLLVLSTFLSVSSPAFAQSKQNPESALPPVSVTVAQAPSLKAKLIYRVKLVTTTDFENNHLAKSKDEALTKARNRPNGGQLLHYMKSTDLSSLPLALERKFENELSKTPFIRPVPDIPPNNYWVDGKYPVWEYDRNKDKITEKKVQLCLGLINFQPNETTKKVEIGLHHIQQVL